MLIFPKTSFSPITGAKISYSGRTALYISETAITNTQSATLIFGVPIRTKAWTARARRTIPKILLA